MSLDFFDADGKFNLSGIEIVWKWLSDFSLNGELISYLTATFASPHKYIHLIVLIIIYSSWNKPKSFHEKF